MSDELFSPMLSIAVRSAMLFVMALLAARVAVRRSAALRHAVYLAAVVGVIVMPALAIALPDVRAPFLAHAVTSSLEWLQRPIRSLRGDGIARHAGVTNDEQSVVDALSLEVPDERGPVSRGFLALVVVWTAGVVVVGGRTALRSIRAGGLTRRALPVRDPRLLAMARSIANRQSQATPRILETAEVLAPATAGILTGVVLLPVTRAWTDEHARTVLAHELAHVARRDCLTQHLAQVACALHWFNPLVWVLERRMALERERACDDIAVQYSASADGYAMLLLDLARRTRERAAAPAAVLAMAQPSELETRLLAILDPVRDRARVSRRSRRTITGMATVIVGLAGVVNLEAAASVPNGQAPVIEPGVMPPQGRTEPDTRNDSVSHPRSERVGRVRVELARRRGRVALTGRDSALARVLLASLEREPRGPEDLVRERAAWALSQTQGSRLTEPLIEALEHADWRIRAYAAWSLTPTREVRAVPALIRQMSHPVWRLRAMAAHALAEIGDARARPVMTAASTDEAWQVRVNGIRYLARFTDADAQARVRAARTDSHVAVRNAAERALAR